MPRAFILGGTGAIGTATARRLLAAGWDIDVTGCDAARMPARLTVAGARFVAADRTRDAFGAGAGLLVHCRCYSAAHARDLLEPARDADSTVMLSEQGRGRRRRRNHTNSDVPPRFDGPIRETQPTTAPGGRDDDTREGYGADKAAAERVLLDSGLPVTVLRPSKVHGAFARRPREWVFVKRVLDRRPAVFLAHRGEGVDHTTAAANVAALIEVVAAKPGTRLLNSADPDAPSALEIARTVARRLGHEWEEVLVGDGSLGAHPRDARPPIVLDTTAAVELGYEPVGDSEATVPTRSTGSPTTRPRGRRTATSSSRRSSTTRRRIASPRRRIATCETRLSERPASDDSRSSPPASTTRSRTPAGSTRDSRSTAAGSRSSRPRRASSGRRRSREGPRSR
jgi:nucleoside-diphosphate-sugar epimerase